MNEKPTPKPYQFTGSWLDWLLQLFVYSLLTVLLVRQGGRFNIIMAVLLLVGSVAAIARTIFARRQSPPH